MKNEVRKHKILGRPCASTEERRSVKVAVFLTIAEAEEVKNNCEKSGISLPAFLRQVGLDKKIETQKSVFDAIALKELRAIGKNLNQIARELSRARAKMLPPDFQNIEKILRDQLEILHALKIEIINHN